MPGILPPNYLQLPTPERPMKTAKAAPTAAEIRDAIARVSVYAGDGSEDRAEADRLFAALALLTQAELFGLLTGAGLEGIRRGDAKAMLLRRLYNRLTARVRAREPAEV